MAELIYNKIFSCEQQSWADVVFVVLLEPCSLIFNSFLCFAFGLTDFDCNFFSFVQCSINQSSFSFCEKFYFFNSTMFEMFKHLVLFDKIAVQCFHEEFLGTKLFENETVVFDEFVNDTFVCQ